MEHYNIFESKKDCNTFKDILSLVEDDVGAPIWNLENYGEHPNLKLVN